jgi:hypothetical protein
LRDGAPEGVHNPHPDAPDTEAIRTDDPADHPDSTGAVDHSARHSPAVSKGRHSATRLSQAEGFLKSKTSTRDRVPAKMKLLQRFSRTSCSRSDGALAVDGASTRDAGQRTCRPREMCGDNSHARPTARRIGTAPTWPALVKPDRHAPIWQREDIRETNKRR